MKKVLAGGAFNIIHPGHVHFLKEAKKLGDFLTVVIANDNMVRKSKGYLLFPAEERKRVVESIRFVDRVLIGDKRDMFKVVETARPQVIALGFDQRIDANGLRQRAAKIGLEIKIVKIGKIKNCSTKKISGKIKRNKK